MRLYSDVGAPERIEARGGKEGGRADGVTMVSSCGLSKVTDCLFIGRLSPCDCAIGGQWKVKVH